MATGRDNFTKETIRQAAERVGYRCSYPQCPNSTVGASMEDNSKVSLTGVACHICAAAKGGPRYDDSMTSEERKSIDNCIWMCQTHSKLIDTDEKTYTVEKLKRWKKDAEEAASKALGNSDFFSEHYKSNGDNFSEIQRLLDDMIIDGRFDELNMLLRQYKTPLSDWYEEFILRYKIIYDVYCSRSSLKEHINAYCELPCKTGVDTLTKLFIAFQLTDELNIIKEFCVSDNIQRFAEMSISDELKNRIVVPIGSKSDFHIPKELETTVSKFVVNYIMNQRIIGATGTDGNAYPLFDDEFYYHVIVAAHNIASMSVYGNDSFESLITSPDFLFLTENIGKIKLLDLSLQENIWAQLLTVISIDYDKFHEILLLCPNGIKEKASVKRATLICQITHDLPSVDVGLLLSYSDATKDYSPLLIYLTRVNNDEAVQLLDDHAYLYRENSAFLQIKYDMSFKIDPSAGYDFLMRYEENYREDFTFQCLAARCIPDSEQKSAIIDWLISNHQTGLNSHNLTTYMYVLRDNKRWSELTEIAKLRLPNESLFYLADCLTESKTDSFLLTSQSIYQSLLDKNWERRGIRFNLGLIQYHFGYTEAAKCSFQKEFDIYQSTNALNNLIRLRCETNEYIEDYYFEKLKKCIDPQSQNLIGATYMKCQNMTEARKYFLRSLFLMDVDNQSINGYWQAVAKLPQSVADTVKVDTVCVLKSSNKTIQIAIHTPAVLQGISDPKEFARCKHFSSEDKRIVPLLYRGKGDLVTFDDEQFTIESVTNADNVFIGFFFSSMLDRKDVIAISGSTPDEFVSNITAILKSSSEDLEKAIADYNQQEILFPLSSLASIVGKKMLTTFEFLLYENKSHIRNNLSIVNEEKSNPVFVLSYDAIVTLAHLNIDLEDLPKGRIICAPQVKNQIVSDVDDELSSITDEKQKGVMVYSEGKPVLIERTTDWRQNRHAFLLRIKELVNSIGEPEFSLDYEPDDVKLKETICQLFSKQKLYCESGTLALTKKTDRGVLVTDDQFLYGVSFADNMHAVGIIGFFMNVCSNWGKLLSVSQDLCRLNFANYLPLSLYKQMVDLLIEDGSETDFGSNKIQQWLLSDTEGQPSEHHEDVMFVLAKDVFASDYQYLNPNNILGDIAFTIMKKRNPEFLEKCITKALENIYERFGENQNYDDM